MSDFLDKKIEDLTYKELEKMERMLLQAWNHLDPHSELIIVSVPRNDPEERKRILEHILKVHSGKEYEAYCNSQISESHKNTQKNLQKNQNNA